MHSSVVGLLGTSKGRVIDTLHTRICTAAEIAKELKVSPTAVRAQLRELSAQGLVEGIVEHDGQMGRPSEQWRLTDRAYRLYESNDPDVAVGIVSQMNKELGMDVTGGLLAEFMKKRMSGYEEELEHIDDPLERARALAELMTNNGKPTEIVENEEVIRLKHHYCRVADVAKVNRAICAAERQEIARLLQIDGSPDVGVSEHGHSCYFEISKTEI